MPPAPCCKIKPAHVGPIDAAAAHVVPTANA